MKGGFKQKQNLERKRCTDDHEKPDYDI